MRRHLLLSLFLAALAAGCKEEPKSLNFYCDETVEKTVSYSSAIAYGIDIAPPVVTGAPSMTETDLGNVDIGNVEKLGLLFMNRNRQIFHDTCSGDLCDTHDWVRISGQCGKEVPCKLVGAVKHSTFYPLYTSDTEGNHICAER